MSKSQLPHRNGPALGRAMSKPEWRVGIPASSRIESEPRESVSNRPSGVGRRPALPLTTEGAQGHTNK
eukprot:3454208-Pyramimonas_sp.AAC.1